MADVPVTEQDASADFWELSEAADDSVGDFPQVQFCKPPAWEGSGGLGADAFPLGPIPEQKLQKTAHWTDVLSSSLWSGGYLLNDKALAVFKQCDLGESREYPAVVSDLSAARCSLTYLYVRNEVPPEAIDFERSEFYVAEMLGVPKAAVRVLSFEDWWAKTQRARTGKLDGCEEFSRLEFKRLYFKKGHAPSVDLFRLQRLSSRTYISARLKTALVNAGLTGLEIKPNRRLFAAT